MNRKREDETMRHPADFPIDTEADVFRFSDALHAAGIGFHLDDTMTAADLGESEEVARRLDTLRRRCFEVMEDPHEASLWSAVKHYNDPAEMWARLEEQMQADLTASKPTPALIMRRLATAGGRTELGTRVAEARKYDPDNGTRLTDCCGACSTFTDAGLCCKGCWASVPDGQGDGTEVRS